MGHDNDLICTGAYLLSPDSRRMGNMDGACWILTLVLLGDKLLLLNKDGAWAKFMERSGEMLAKPYTTAT